MGYIFQDGWTALHKAAYHCRLEIATLLISNGCDLNTTDKVSHTYV